VGPCVKMILGRLSISTEGRGGAIWERMWFGKEHKKKTKRVLLYADGDGDMTCVKGFLFPYAMRFKMTRGDQKL
jgi:hypothetical protein